MMILPQRHKACNAAYYNYPVNLCRRVMLLLLLCCICHGPASFAQQKDTSNKTFVYLTADTVFGFKTDTGDLTKFVGKAVFRQGTDTLYCDSLYQYKPANIIEAFSNVRIAQAGGTQGTSDYLRYIANQKLAYMRGNVIIADGKNNLKSENLTYDLGTKVGNYMDGGTLHNDSTTVYSKMGVYDVNSKDARFTGNVIIDDPEYKIRSEDLVYNTESKVTRFYAKSVVTRDSGKSILETRSGTYDGKYGIAHFVGHSTIWNDGEYIEGDSLDYNKVTGHGLAIGNVICIDTAHHSRLFCGRAEYFHKRRVLWAIIKPVLEQVNGKDTFYMRSDTFYSAPMVKSELKVKNKKPKVIADSNVIKTDSTAVAEPDAADMKLRKREQQDTTATKTTKNAIDTPQKVFKPLGPFPYEYVDSAEIRDSLKRIRLAREDSIAAKLLKDKKNPHVNVNWIVPPNKYRIKDTATDRNRDTTKIAAIPVKKKPSKRGIKSSNILVSDTSVADTTAPMYFVGWNHVLIFSDSMQGKCDSICYTRSDSMIRMIVKPISWAHASQITGDTILLQLDSSAMKSMYVPNNALVVSQSGPPKAGLFNQVQGKTLTAWFKNNTITHILVTPESECIYYAKDESDAYMGVNQAKGDSMLVFFDDEKVTNIKLLHNTHQTVTPMEKVDIPNTKLSRFIWLIEDRPKTKEELFR